MSVPHWLLLLGAVCYAGMRIERYIQEKTAIALAARLYLSEQRLRAAVTAAGGHHHTIVTPEFPPMANPIVPSLIEQVAATVTAEASAVLLIDGIGKQIEDAVKAAIGNGATAEELAPLTGVIANLEKSRDALAAAVAANTPK